jgi:tRNA A-37 threonylcarbamoyl transferase component Bud32
VATTAPPPAGATQPTLLAKRYRLDRRLAHGGMSEVWVATDTVLDRHVAVKVLKPSLADDPIVVERFRREAVAAAGLNHPYIVSIYDTVEDGGREAVVMELVPGRSLRSLLDERRRLSVDDTLVIGRAMTAALDHAHRAGLVHRDVKPGNVLVTPEGRVKLTDFGIAKALEQRHEDLTAENVMMGTAKYLSPEQVLGFPLDGRADLYSLGLVLYECLTGKTPFTGATDGAIAIARLQRDPAPIRRLRPEVPAPVADAITCLLARRPEDRPASAAMARAMLSEAAGGRDDATLPPLGPPPPDRSRPPGTTPPRPRADPEAPTAPGRHLRGRARAIVVGAAIAGALGVGAVAIARAGDGGASASPNGPSVVNVPGAPLGSVPATLGPLGSALGPVAIADISEFDPSPGNGAENPDALGRLTDGDAATAWTTVCYESKYLYPKRGVGLELGLTGPVAGQRLRIAWPTGPWRVAIYTAAQPGARLEDWGKPLATRGSDAPGDATFALGDSDHRYVLVWLTQLSRSSACSANPYRGAVGELTVEPAA